MKSMKSDVVIKTEYAKGGRQNIYTKEREKDE